MKKTIDRLISLFAAAAFISILSAASYYHGQYLKTAAADKLEKNNRDIIEFIKSNIKTCAINKNYNNSIFYEPVISIDLSDMSVRPPHYKARLLSELELKYGVFDDAVLSRLKSVIKTEPPETAASILSYYLSDIPDSYSLEKAVLYIYLIKIKTDIDQPVESELKSFKTLADTIKNENERKFLYEKLKESVVSAKNISGADLSDLLSGRTNGSDKNTGLIETGKNLTGENISALLLGLKSEALSKSSGGLNMSSLSTDDNKNYILVSLSVENNGDHDGGENTAPTSAPGLVNASDSPLGDNAPQSPGTGDKTISAHRKISTAAIINVEKFNAILKTEYNSRIDTQSHGAPYYSDFCAPYKLSLAGGGIKRNYLIETAFYLPLMITLAVFYILKRRENEAFRLSVNMTDFVSKISHQLKTPLSSSLLYLELAGRHLESGDAEKARGAIALAHEQAGALAFLFENYSVLNRIFSDNVLLEISSFDIEEELILHIKSYKNHIESGALKISFSLSENNGARIDKWAFYNIIANLISNSLKYSNKKTVEINFTSKLIDGSLVLSITDNGPGISETDAARIFDKFYKGEEAAGDFRSSGLGLYIAKTLALKMNGDLLIDDKYKNGAKFNLYMPAAN